MNILAGMLSIKTSYRKTIYYSRTTLIHWLTSGFFILLADISAPAFAQGQQSQTTILDTINITATTRSERSSAQIPNRITQITRTPQHNYQPGTTLNECVDGIPATLPDGQTQLNSIDPALIKRMDIVRRPSAALYGNAFGELIDITTRKAPPEKFVIMPRQVFGQYGYLKSELFTGERNGNLGYSLLGSHLQRKDLCTTSRILLSPRRKIPK